MNRRTFARSLGLGALAAGLAPAARAQPAGQNLKLVIIGDDGVGKTSLLIAYTTNAFLDQDVPSVYDNYTVNVAVKGRSINIGLWDTSGKESYDRLRPFTYPKTDCFLVCFDVSNRASFERLETKWKPEIAQHAPGVPFIVAGAKLDLRDAGKGAVGTHEAIARAEKLGAAAYHECSAKTQVGVKHAFDSAIRVMLI
jgi:Ras-related C3 botulinum toxin substrate 1